MNPVLVFSGTGSNSILPSANAFTATLIVSSTTASEVSQSSKISRRQESLVMVRVSRRRENHHRNLRGDGAYKTRLYRALGYDTFEECCEKETEASKSRVDRLIGAAAVCEILTPIGSKTPTRESHARPLTALRNGEDKLDKGASYGRSTKT